VCNFIKQIRGKLRFYLQIALEGLPVPRRNKDGSFRHKLGKGIIGGDMDTQTKAIVSKDKVFLKKLSHKSRKN